MKWLPVRNCEAAGVMSKDWEHSTQVLWLVPPLRLFNSNNFATRHGSHTMTKFQLNYNYTYIS